MKKQTKQYNHEEKAKVVLEVMAGELTMAQITSNTGFILIRFYRWKKEALESIISGFKSKSKKVDTSQEDLIKSLYEQIGQLTVGEIGSKKI